MSKLLKMFGMAALLGALIMTGGCGGSDDETPVVTSVTSPIVGATVNPSTPNTATTGAGNTIVTTPPGTTGYLITGGVSVSLPAGTVITAPTAITLPPSLTFTAPSDSTPAFSGTNGVPVPTGRLAVASTAGAVDVQLTGAASATFNPAITITVPVPGKAVGSVVTVYTVSGTTYSLLGNFTVATAGFVRFPVSSLSWKVCNPIFTTPTGSTGSPGGSL
jgi:hypothetical protein